ncbi:hypothetical protein BGY98DRAFT_960295 [Russula aff. rugulosa BPL654]|nr:hypothetical protein BGY98DRAFT_960295 [Russula aff. rugulosa BPL654]
MVSFQYVPCTDVVKKPKLDNHYGQCRSSFTCIDCSSTFAGPVEWKVHTSCITEAEKYQKSMYKGPKKGHTQLRTTNSTGKYHQSNGIQSRWSRPQYIRDCASGANTTPLGSPRRMSPVDPSAVKPSPSVADAATKAERGDVEQRDVEKHTPNGTEPKEKKGRRNMTLPEDMTRKTHHHHEMKPPRRETSGDDTQSKTQSVTEDKKVKKRKKEEKGEKARLKQGDVSKETNTPPEPVVPSVDDGTKGDKKRKHKEKKEGSTETNHDSLATRLGPLAAQTDDAKGENKKKKGKEDKAAGKKRKHEGSAANEVKRRKQQEQE